VYTLWFRHVAQRGGFSSGHPIVEEEKRRAGQGVRVNVSNVPSMGPGPPVSHIIAVVDPDAKSVSRRCVPASPVSLLAVPKVNTGGERQIQQPR